ncbi:MAG: hypothetical protein ACOYS2_03870, partial [Patescibacteria group bacterium]
MEQKTLKALKWIVGILNDNKIPYRIGGGLAVNLYGSDRSVSDIDISISGKYFEKIVPLVKDFIIAGPKHYLNEKWDCITLSLNYFGQDIDLTDVETLLMKTNDGKWVKNREIYERFQDVERDLDSVKITLMNPKSLLEYKEHLQGEHQEYDRKFLK